MRSHEEQEALEAAYDNAMASYRQAIGAEKPFREAQRAAAMLVVNLQAAPDTVAVSAALQIARGLLALLQSELDTYEEQVEIWSTRTDNAWLASN